MFEHRRPDLRQGVFETLLVLDGRPVELDAHLTRLRRSLGKLFPDRAAIDLPELDVPIGRGVMRIDASLESTTVAFRDLEERAEKVALRSLALPGGLGEHKWADRSLLEQTQATLPGGTLPLVVDADGAALEASRANLFVVRDGALRTPPLDGRILPGITRRRVLELAAGLGIEAHEQALTRDDLLAADAAFLTGSVRGIEPAGSLDGAPFGGDRAVPDRLAGQLWRYWRGS